MSPYLTEVRRTLRLGVPMIIGQLAHMLMHVMDTLMLGHAEAAPGGGVLGVAASTAVGVIISVAMTFGFGLSVPVHVLCAQALGAADPAGAVRVLRHGWLSVWSYGLLIGLVFTLGSDLFGWFGFPEEVVEVGTPYGVLLAWSLLPIFLFQVMRNYAESHHQPWMPLWIALGGVALNILLNAVLIFGWGPLEARGIIGAGEATVLARWATVGLLGWYLLRSDKFPLRLADLGWGGWSLAELRRYLAIGLPSGAQISVEIGTFAVAATVVGWLGATALAAHQLAINFSAVAFMVPLGMSFATGIRVGHAKGAGDPVAIRRIGLSSICFSATLMGMFGLCFLTFRHELPRIFFRAENLEAAPVIALAARFLMVAALFSVVDGMQVSAVAALRGMGDVKVPTLWVLVGYWGIAVPLAVLLTFGPETPFPDRVPFWGGRALPVGADLGGVGVWIALAVGLGWAAMALTRRFWRRTRLHP